MKRLSRITQRKWYVFTAFIFFVFFSFDRLSAASYFWIAGNTSNNWGLAANWSSSSGGGGGAGIPGAGDDVTFDNMSGAGVILLTSGIPVAINSLTINGATTDVTLQSGSQLDVNTIGIGGIAGSRLGIASGMTVRLVASGTTLAPNCFLVVSGTLIVGNGFFMNNNSTTSGFTVNNGGSIVITGNARIDNNSPLYNTGSTLVYSGSPAKSMTTMECPLTIPPGVTVIIDNSAGVMWASNRTVQGILLIKDTRTLTISQPCTINGTGSMPTPGGKLQIEGAINLLGMVSVTYTGSKDTLEFIGANSCSIDNNGTLAQEVSGAGPMNGTILVNKSTPTSAINGISGTLNANGSFLLKQGTWNVNTGGFLTFGGLSNYYTTSTGTATLNISANAALVLGPNRILTNDGAVNIAANGRCLINDQGAIVGANAVTYQATSATLRYAGGANKITTAQELPAIMQGSVIFEHSVGNVQLGTPFTNVLGTTIVSTATFDTGGNTLQLSGWGQIAAPATCQISANGVLLVFNGAGLSKLGSCNVANGGTLRLDGTGQVSGAAPISYSNGSNLLYTGGSNRATTSTELPSPSTLSVSLHVNKTPLTTLDITPPSSTLITLNGTSMTAPILSVTSGIIRTGRGANSILLIANVSANAVTFANTGTGYIEGPLQRQITNGVSYFYPLGDGGRFLPASISNISGAMAAPVVTIEATSANAAGTPGNALSLLSTTEYWRVKIGVGSINSARIGLYRSSGSWTNPAVVTMSDTLTAGLYKSVGGTSTLNGLVSDFITTSQWGTAQRHFVVGTVSLPVKSALGYQLQFNGTNQEVVAPAKPAYDALTDLTFEALVRPYWTAGTPPTDPCIASFGDAASQNFSLSVGQAYVFLKVGTNNGGTVVQKNITPTFRRNQYYHIAVTYSAGVLTYYVDGKLMGTDNITLTSVNGKPLHIGSRGGIADFWQGAIDEVRLWNTALPQTTVAAWKRRELDAGHPNTANLVGYWRFNDGYPQSAADLSTHANHATLIN
ncbi:MAG: LamG-like jellyroll fold domain-containing protein, partial [Candidatus Kapaibacteriota bacterium]